MDLIIICDYISGFAVNSNGINTETNQSALTLSIFVAMIMVITFGWAEVVLRAHHISILSTPPFFFLCSQYLYSSLVGPRLVVA